LQRVQNSDKVRAASSPSPFLRDSSDSIDRILSKYLYGEIIVLG